LNIFFGSNPEYFEALLDEFVMLPLDLCQIFRRQALGKDPPGCGRCFEASHKHLFCQIFGDFAGDHVGSFMSCAVRQLSNAILALALCVSTEFQCQSMQYLARIRERLKKVDPSLFPSVIRDFAPISTDLACHVRILVLGDRIDLGARGVGKEANFH
jgi:hypothetical protein